MRWLVLWVLIHLSAVLFSQETEREVSVIREEDLTTMATEQWEGKQILLEQYQKRPLDLNRCTAEELAELGLLTPLQVDAWIQFREKFGAAADWYVFQGVPGWSEVLLSRLKNYCRLGSSGEHADRSFFGSVRQLVMVRIAMQQPTNLPNGYLGAPVSRQFRYRFQSEKGIQAGLLMESDAGETFGRQGPDFWSGFLQRKKTRSGMDWLIGDYTVQLGQGLICWQGMAFGMGADLSAVKRQGLTIRPYQSVGESRFLRGIAVGKQAGKWSWDLFSSRKGQSATLYSTSEGVMGFKQVDASGYHRTASERNKKNSLMEYTMGARIGSQLREARWNFNFMGRKWSVPSFRTTGAPTSDTAWVPSLGNFSLDASFTKGSVHFFGEWAMDDRMHGAGVFGLVSVIDRRVDVSAQYRWIGDWFQSVDGQAFQRSSSGKPERGIYFQLRVRPTERHTLDLYSDLHYMNQLASPVAASSHGIIRGLRWLYQPDKKSSLQVRMQTVLGEGIDQESIESAIRFTRHYSFRVHGNFAVDEQKTLSLRVEKTTYKVLGKKPQQGFLSYVEWRRSFPVGLVADLRLMWASTDGWAARVYAYERDVLFKVGFPAFYGRVVRGYLNLAVPLGRKTMIWAKVYADKDIENQSIKDEKGLIRTGLTLQLRHQW